MAAFEYRTSVDVRALNIEGERIRLELISQRFAKAIFEAFTSEVTRYMFPQPAKDIAETRAFVDSSLKRLANNLQLVILNKATGEFLGCCGLHGANSARNPELGIWLKRSAHAHGYGREAIHTLVAWARENMVLDSLIYPVDKENTASRAIPLSLGAKVTGERVDTGLAGNTLDLVFYEIGMD